VATADVVINAVVVASNGRTREGHPDISDPSAINDVSTTVVSTF